MKPPQKYILIISVILVLLILAAIFIWEFNLVGTFLNIIDGEEFVLKVGDVANVKGKQISLKLLNYGCFNNGCPGGVECLWQGGTVCLATTQLTVGDKTYDQEFSDGFGLSFSFPYLSENNNYTVLFNGKIKIGGYYVFFIGKTEDICSKRGIDQSSKDLCWHKAAGSLGDSSYYCEQINEEKLKSICLEEMAIKTDDDSICEKIDDPSYCLRSLAIETKRVSLCDKIENVKERDFCFSQFGECNKIIDKELKETECRINLAVKNNDPMVCFGIPNEWAIDRCLRTMALDLPTRAVICEKITNESYKNRCLNVLNPR